jgi:hypothetical protein
MSHSALARTPSSKQEVALRHYLLTLTILTACSGRDVPIATRDPDAPWAYEGISLPVDGTMSTPEGDMQQFQDTAMAIATAAGATPLTCTYEDALTGEVDTVTFGVDVAPVGGAPCLTYADCPYDFSWEFVDVHPSGAPKSFSMVAMYRQGIDTLQRSSSSASGTTTTTFAYRFVGFYTDALTLVRHDTASSHSVDILYVKIGDSGVIMRVTCSPITVASGL